VAEPDLAELLGVFERHGVRYVVIGAQAAVIRGVPLVTEDLDVTPARDRENIVRLADALVELEPRLRTSSEPEGLPFPVDPELLATADTWNLTTRLGELDLAFAPAGTGGYDDLRRDATLVELASGLVVPVASLADVIRSKEAAGREKDRAQLPLMRRTLEETRARAEERQRDTGESQRKT
jgi:hypothetical protein